MNANENQESDGQTAEANSADDLIVIEPMINSNSDQETETGEKQKCKSCDYKTNIPVHLKGHNRVQHEGQYQCQMGCKARFVKLSQLDEHVKEKHNVHKAQTFDCGECDKKLSEKHQLRQHLTVKHRETRTFNCKNSGEVLAGEVEMNNHMEC